MGSESAIPQFVVHAIPSWFDKKEITVMVCRSWMLTDSFGRQIGKEYILSDNEGFVFQAEARCPIPTSFLCSLADGQVYRLKEFRLLSNTSAHRFNKDASLSLQLDENTIVAQATCCLDGFIRHPLLPVLIEDISDTESKYLIDVIGVVVDLGVSRPTKRGSFIVDCYIVSAMGLAMRVTLWNEAAGAVIHMQQSKAGLNLCVLAGVAVRDFRGELYLSSTQATAVYNLEEFPAEHEKFMGVRHRNQSAFVLAEPETPVALSDNSLTQLLYLGRALQMDQIKDSVTLNCRVKILGARLEHPWFNYTCPFVECQKGVISVGGVFWCDSCEVLCRSAPSSYRLHLEVTDGISKVTIAFLDGVADALLGKSATALVAELGNDVDSSVPPNIVLALYDTWQNIEVQSHTYYDYISHESFTASRVFPPMDMIQLGIVPQPSEPILGLFDMETNGGGETGSHMESTTNIERAKDEDEGEV